MGTMSWSRTRMLSVTVDPSADRGTVQSYLIVSVNRSKLRFCPRIPIRKLRRKLAKIAAECSNCLEGKCRIGMIFWVNRLCVGLLLFLPVCGGAHAQLRGYGGPVKALAISPDGAHAISGSFDTSAISWSLSRNTAEQVLRFHDGAVNAVAYLKDGRIVTAGADAHIAVWSAGQPQPEKVFDGHSGPVSNLAVSPDGSMIASASWDRSVRLWPVNGGPVRVLEGQIGRASC